LAISVSLWVDITTLAYLQLNAVGMEVTSAAEEPKASEIGSIGACEVGTGLS